MKLESLLKPLKQIVKPIDEPIHQQYERLGSMLDEASPKARYYVSAGIQAMGYPGAVIAKTPIPAFIYCFSIVPMAYGCCFGINNEDFSGAKVDTPPVFDLYSGIASIIRSPVLLTGIGLTIKGICGLVNGLVNGESDISESLTVYQGLSLICASSSMFLNDRNPKLLEKEPFWKKAYNWIKKKKKK